MITFEDAFWWLNKFVGLGGPYLHLSFTADELRMRLDGALAIGFIARILELINMMFLISKGSTDPFERAEIQLVCARAYFIEGDYVKALDLLDNAIQAYVSDSHNQAVVFWMKGCVLLEMLGNNVDTILLWQRSLEKFNKLAKSQYVRRGGADWYLGRCIEMKDDINASI